jgi:CMP/dCMP kinase
MNAAPIRHYVISIDGGAGTGKTTSAQRVAERLGFCYVDSGAVYRAVALALRERAILDAADPRVVEQVDALPIRIRPEPGRFRVFLDDRELLDELRTPEIGAMASKLAVVSRVRARVCDLLREANRIGSLVIEGRDIGTVVFPGAILKVYLQAELPVRAARRRADLSRQGIAWSAEEVARDLAERDHRDSTREDSPLRVPEGAVVVDTSACGIDEQVETIVAAFHRVRRAAEADSSEGPAA